MVEVRLVDVVDELKDEDCVEEEVAVAKVELLCVV